MSDEFVTIDRDEFEYIKGQLAWFEFELTRLLSQPLVHATVVKSENKFKLDVFEEGDRLLVIDPALRKQKKLYGKLASKGVDEEGWLIIEYYDGKRDRLNIGLNGNAPQVKLVGKDDGTNVTITIDGKLFEVHGIPGKEFYPSENVKVDMETRQIHDKVGVSAAGDVAYVKQQVDENHVEVDLHGQSRVVIVPPDFAKAESGQRVMVDNSNTMVVRLLEPEDKERFNLLAEVNVEWNDIAGLDGAKEELIEALELPYQHPEIFQYYNKKQPKGVLLYGPQGCGKTLMGKAAANSLARIHGKDNYRSGFIYIKGPEILSKWVGVAEAGVRELFQRGRKHYEKYGYPALMFIDEADAILFMRGTGKSSDVENTIVPMFLSEMDGLHESHVMVMLATNQPKRLDPAVVREGRVDRHIRVSRPTIKNASEYFRIHMRGLPMAKGHEPEEAAAIAVAELFAQHRVLYRVTHRNQAEVFRLGDCVTGAMIAGVCDTAKSRALRRDLNGGNKKDKGKGVRVDDFRESVQSIYLQHADLNPTFDLEDFCDRHGFSRCDTKIEKLALSTD